MKTIIVHPTKVPAFIAAMNKLKEEKEKRMAKHFEKIEPWVKEFKETGKWPAHIKWIN